MLKTHTQTHRLLRHENKNKKDYTFVFFINCAIILSWSSYSVHQTPPVESMIDEETDNSKKRLPKPPKPLVPKIPPKPTNIMERRRSLQGGGGGGTDNNGIDTMDSVLPKPTPLQIDDANSACNPFLSTAIQGNISSSTTPSTPDQLAFSIQNRMRSPSSSSRFIQTEPSIQEHLGIHMDILPSADQYVTTTLDNSNSNNNNIDDNGGLAVLSVEGPEPTGAGFPSSDEEDYNRDSFGESMFHTDNKSYTIHNMTTEQNNGRSSSGLLTGAFSTSDIYTDKADKDDSFSDEEGQASGIRMFARRPRSRRMSDAAIPSGFCCIRYICANQIRSLAWYFWCLLVFPVKLVESIFVASMVRIIISLIRRSPYSCLIVFVVGLFCGWVVAVAREATFTAQEDTSHFCQGYLYIVIYCLTHVMVAIISSMNWRWCCCQDKSLNLRYFETRNKGVFKYTDFKGITAGAYLCGVVGLSLPIMSIILASINESQEILHIITDLDPGAAHLLVDRSHLTAMCLNTGDITWNTLKIGVAIFCYSVFAAQIRIKEIRTTK